MQQRRSADDAGPDAARAGAPAPAAAGPPAGAAPGPAPGAAGADAPTGAAGPPGADPSLLRLVGPPLAGYAALRTVQLLVLALVPGHRSVADRVLLHDGGWYAAIAVWGYPHSLPVGPAGVRPNRIAFFPGYPMAVRAVGATGTPVWLGELVVSVAAGALAVVLVCLVAVQVAGPDAGRRTALAWLLVPSGFVLGIGYAEGLFVAAAAGCLLALLRRYWLIAGLAGALATATRPTGLALVAAALAAAVPPLVTRRAVRPLIAVALVPAGGLGYLGWAWARTGRADAWFATERQAWGAHLDFGLAMLKVGGYTVLHPLQRPLYVVVAMTVLISAGLLVLAVRDRLPGPLLAYAAGVVALGAGSGIATVGSYPRIALTAFPLLIPLGTRLGRLPRPARLATAATAAAALLGATVLATVTGTYIP